MTLPHLRYEVGEHANLFLPEKRQYHDVLCCYKHQYSFEDSSSLPVNGNAIIKLFKTFSLSLK